MLCAANAGVEVADALLADLETRVPPPFPSALIPISTVNRLPPPAKSSSSSKSMPSSGFRLASTLVMSTLKLPALFSFRSQPSSRLLLAALAATRADQVAVLGLVDVHAVVQVDRIGGYSRGSRRSGALGAGDVEHRVAGPRSSSSIPSAPLSVDDACFGRRSSGADFSLVHAQPVAIEPAEAVPVELRVQSP